ncbi:MAG: putative selenium-dependent hydroxylase accessory protein YqeC [Anaerolineae bacterium]|nr:putative selenium-dependent hydroxylase accessory protein YqeC [Anaerolineae bacterium]
MPAIHDAPWLDGRVIALVGAGGKTSLAWRITRQLLARDERVLFTTTTHCLLPAAGAFDVNVVEPRAEDALVRLGQMTWRGAFAAASIVGPFAGERAGWMPTQPLKARGFAPTDIASFLSLDARLVVEADGAQGRWIKAPGAHEPAIPARADVVFCVVCIDAIGQTLDASIAHRPEGISALTGLPMGDAINETTVARLLTADDGGRKGIPNGARAIAALTRIRSARRPELEEALLQGGFDAVLDIDLSENPGA